MNWNKIRKKNLETQGKVWQVKKIKSSFFFEIFNKTICKPILFPLNCFDNYGFDFFILLKNFDIDKADFVREKIAINFSKCFFSKDWWIFQIFYSWNLFSYIFGFIIVFSKNNII